MATDLREQLIGAWRLVSYAEEPQGIITYTPDGYLSAHLAKPNRSRFVSGDWFKGSDEEYRTEVNSHLARRRAEPR